MTKFSEWTYSELEEEQERLIRKYPSVDHPFSPEVDADMTRLLEVQMAVFQHWQRKNPSLCIFSPYMPLIIHRTIDVKDLFINGTYPRPK